MLDLPLLLRSDPLSTAFRAPTANKTEQPKNNSEKWMHLFKFQMSGAYKNSIPTILRTMTLLQSVRGRFHIWFLKKD